MATRILTRRHAIRQSIAAAAGVVAAPFINRGRYRVFAQSPVTYSSRAIKVVSESIVVDMLSPLSLGPNEPKWMKDPDSFTAADLQRFKDSGITSFHIARGTGGPEAYERTLWFLSGFNGFVAARSDAFARIDSVDDFARAKAAGKIGVLLGVQNSEHFRSADDVAAFHALGQRVSQLTYNARNLIGNGSTERRDEGLSDFGVSIVAKMNAAGMAVDVSHCGDRTSLDAFEVSKAPVLITHSNVRALNPGHPRCKPDEVIRACGKAGSVMGITGVRNFVKGSEPTTIEDYLNHIEYVAKMIGIEHVGIGSDIDLDGYDDMPAEDYKKLKAAYKDTYAFRDKIDIEGIDHLRRMFDIAEGLIRRGYSNPDIAGILGGNWVRILKQAWTPVAA
ncbi:MAG: dipeptidase [Vicinamibacteria bacterium]|nr:dipeptidase [Vicinamibacteria bacterium]